MLIISTLNYHVVTLNFHKLCGLIVLSLLSIFASAAYGQGFDCTKATTEIEKMICSDKELSALDDTLNETYKAAQKFFPDGNVMRSLQQFWLKSTRNTATDMEKLKKVYRERVELLKGCCEIQRSGNLAWVMVPLGQNAGSYPRLYDFPDKEVLKKVNTQIDESIKNLRCFNGEGSYSTTTEVTFSKENIFSIKAISSWYCGGAYPTDDENLSMTFDLKTGNRIGFSSLFTDYGKNEDAIISTALHSLVYGHECSSELSVERLARLHLNMYITEEGVIVQPSLPHAIAACSRAVRASLHRAREYIPRGGVLRRIYGQNLGVRVKQTVTVALHSLVYGHECSSEQGGHGAALALDGDVNTFWHTQWTPLTATHPHEFIIKTDQGFDISGFRYIARPGAGNGTIANYEIYLSTDGLDWGPAVTTGTWIASALPQDVYFTAQYAKYVKLVALSEVNGGPWASAAELVLFHQTSAYSTVSGTVTVAGPRQKKNRATNYWDKLVKNQQATVPKAELINQFLKVIVTDEGSDVRSKYLYDIYLHRRKQIPRAYQYNPNYTDYYDNNRHATETDRGLALDIFNISRRPEDLQNLFISYKSLLVATLPPSKYKKYFQRYVQGLIDVYRHIVMQENYRSVFDDLEKNISILTKQMQDRAGSPYPLSLNPYTTTMFKNLYKDEVVSFKYVDQQLWLHSFWLRRYMEGNMDVVYGILTEIKDIYTTN